MSGLANEETLGEFINHAYPLKTKNAKEEYIPKRKKMDEEEDYLVDFIKLASPSKTKNAKEEEDVTKRKKIEEKTYESIKSVKINNEDVQQNSPHPSSASRDDNAYSLLNIASMIKNKESGVYELVKGKKAIIVNLDEEENIFVTWYAEGKKPLRLTLEQFGNLEAQHDKIDEAFKLDSPLFKKDIGNSTYVTVTDFFDAGKVVNIRVFYKLKNNTFQPTKTGITIKQATWNKINWNKIGQHISFLQGSTCGIIKTCAKIIGKHIAKKVKSFCHECINSLDDEVHDCMRNEGHEYIRYKNKIRYQSDDIISETTDEEIIAMISNVTQPQQYEGIIKFIRNNPVIIGEYAQYAIEG